MYIMIIMGSRKMKSDEQRLKLCVTDLIDIVCLAMVILTQLIKRTAHMVKHEEKCNE